jgi:hypothetical protein
MKSRREPEIAGAESFWDYREVFKQRVRRFYRMECAEAGEVHETEASPAPLNERLLHLIWKEQSFDTSGLRLVDGRSIRIEEYGRPNGAGGPDFQNARIMIDGEWLRGDIEMHLNASGWRAHGHERDIDYNGVVLHVVLFNDDGRTDDRLHNGRSLPRLELEPYLIPDLDAFRRTLGAEDFAYGRPSSVGRCYDVMTSATPEELSGFLDYAGDERFNAKVRRLEDQLERADAGQVFYQTMMSSLGSGSGKPLYYLLAKRAPLAELKREIGETSVSGSSEIEAAERIESVLLHVGGLVPREAETEGAPEESLAHAARLRERWLPLEPYWQGRIIAPTRTWFRDIRPVNFPPRRLAGVARLLARSFMRGSTPLADLIECVKEAGMILDSDPSPRRAAGAAKRLASFFDVAPANGFWETHYSFQARPSEQPMRLIGEATAKSLAFNAALPMAALYARRTGDEALGAMVRRLSETHPKLPGNHVLDFTRKRLFGKDGEPAGMFRSERRQQGLFQIFNSCCNGTLHHCDCCHYLEGLRKGWPLETA